MRTLPLITIEDALSWRRCSWWSDEKVRALWPKDKTHLNALDLLEGVRKAAQYQGDDGPRVNAFWAACHALPLGFLGYSRGRHVAYGHYGAWCMQSAADSLTHDLLEYQNA